MRAFGFWIKQQGIEVINNVRWGTPDTYHYCFDGIPEGNIVAVGSVASGIRRTVNRELFEKGFDQMLKTIKPSAIIIYGSGNSPVIKKAQDMGVMVIPFPSKTSKAFLRGNHNE